MEFKIMQNSLKLNLDNLLSIGYREANAKRNFLFISKCLGKHLIVNPEIVKLTGLLLAYEIYGDILGWNIKELISLFEHPYPNMKDNPEYIKAQNTQLSQNNMLVIGFAETATALGIPIAQVSNAYYVHTSREKITAIPSCLNFEETHSHATTHNCFLCYDNLNIKDMETIVLVDDEITTGNTMLHLIENLEKKYPKSNRKYIIASILDWRSESDLNKFKTFEIEHNLNLQCISLISGNFINNNKEVFPKQEVEEIIDIALVTQLESFTPCPTYTGDGLETYILETGRFGYKFPLDENKYKKAAKQIAEKVDINKRILVVGHGENIYTASRIASYLGADFKTTSRSPIYISKENNYPIKERHFFKDREVTYYFYDKSFIETYYDEVVFITETYALNIKLTKNCKIFRL